MLSAMTGREIGFGRPLTQDELEQVNSKRANQHYADKEAAMMVYKQTKKPPLKQSPFLRTLLIGAGNEGYWNAFHMAVQLEDVVDCLKVLYPEYDDLILFDHSQGHASRREDAQNAGKMAKTHEGAQPKMRSTTLGPRDIGPHRVPGGLKAGDTQKLVWDRMEDGSQGPFYLSPEEKLAQKESQPTGEIKENDEKTKVELLADLKAKRVDIDRIVQYTRKKLQEFAPTVINRVKMKPGWESSPKGLLQVLWERCWIDPERKDEYTLEGPRHPITGRHDLSRSLRHLISACSDFMNERTALQHLGDEIGVQGVHSPKYHAELAGEGVEYHWAMAKEKYRKEPLSRKHKRQSFRALVKECVSSNVLTVEMAKKFSRRARYDICAYYAIHKMNNEAAMVEIDDDRGARLEGHHLAEYQSECFVKIEAMKKKFKSLTRAATCGWMGHILLGGRRS